MGSYLSRATESQRPADEPEPLTLQAVESFVNNRKKEITQQKCQLISFNLLVLLAKTDAGAVDETRFVSELFQTVRCDEFYDLKHVREAYAERIGLEKTLRIVTETNQDSDRESAARAFDHYGEWTRREVVKSLSLPNKVKYYLFLRPFELFATMMTVSGWTAYRIVKLQRTRR